MVTPSAMARHCTDGLARLPSSTGTANDPLVSARRRSCTRRWLFLSRLASRSYQPLGWRPRAPPVCFSLQPASPVTATVETPQMTVRRVMLSAMLRLYPTPAPSSTRTGRLEPAGRGEELLDDASDALAAVFERIATRVVNRGVLRSGFGFCFAVAVRLRVCTIFVLELL